MVESSEQGLVLEFRSRPQAAREPMDGRSFEQRIRAIVDDSVTELMAPMRLAIDEVVTQLSQRCEAKREFATALEALTAELRKWRPQ